MNDWNARVDEQFENKDDRVYCKLLIKQCYVKLEVHSCTNDVVYLCVYIIGCTRTKIDISRKSFVQL